METRTVMTDYVLKTERMLILNIIVEMVLESETKVVIYERQKTEQQETSVQKNVLSKQQIIQTAETV
ncbi:hypothetical protein IJU97_05485 [bacterium]|nr:hypothetical protein [bacterium]